MTTQVNLYLDRARMAARIGVIGRVTEVRPVERIHRARAGAHLSRQATSPSRSTARPAPASRASARTWRRCWATCSTTPPSGRAPGEPGGVATLPTPRQRRAGNWLEIRVDDDGPGLTAEQMAEPIMRGRRLDETKPGSGLGHSIVADLAYCYSGKFELARSEHGGLSARLTLPLAT